MERSVKGALGRCVPLRRGTGVCSAVAICVISRGWSFAVLSMRLVVWIVVGCKAMVQWCKPVNGVMYREIVYGDFARFIRRSGATSRIHVADGCTIPSF